MLARLLFVLIFILSIPASAKGVGFPKHGEIINPSGRNLILRTGPPKTSSLSYQLGNVICSIGVGSKFIAYDELNLFNGEIWYRVSFDEKDIIGSKGCPSGTLSGWMAGKLKTGWAVEISSSILGLKALVPKHLPKVSSAHDAFEESEQDEKTEEPSPLIKYLLIGIGTILGVTILSISKAESIFSRKWMNSMFFLECGLLLIVNLYIYNSLWVHFSQFKNQNILVGILIIANNGVLGPAILGLVFSAVLLKFTTK